MTRTEWRLLPLVLSACGGGTSDLEPAPPLTLRVPIDQPNLAAALAAAPNGYTIVLSKGTYTGPQNTGLTFPLVCLFVPGSIMLIHSGGARWATAQLLSTASRPVRRSRIVHKSTVLASRLAR